MVPQEPKLFPSLSIRENIELSLEGLKVPASKISEVAKQLGPHIDLSAQAGELSISDQQLVEIMRGILREAKVLIVDEPTSSLTSKEIESLFFRLKQLASDGVGIFYITHRMNEIFELCDRVTVLRDGVVAFTAPVAETTVGEIVRQMVPDTSEARAKAAGGSPTKSSQARGATIDTVLKLKNFSGQGFHHVNLEVGAGEIVGIAGVVGSGRTELAETIYGIRPGVGMVSIADTEYLARTPARSTERGIAYVPEDRHRNGVFLLGDITENTSSAILDTVCNRGIVQAQKERELVSQLTDNLDLQRGLLSRPVGKLSGGNQQKISLAKALASRPKVVILDEPSRGVDVGARSDLYRLIFELAAGGTAIVVISSDFEEIADISDRVLIMRDGTLVDELLPPEISLEAVRDRCFDVAMEVN